MPLNKETCFFCDEGSSYRDSLHKVSTMSAGQAIRSAVEMSGNEKLIVKLSTAIDANDAHAIDVKYHNRCYTNNVTNVLRRESTSNAGKKRNVDRSAS